MPMLISDKKRLGIYIHIPFCLSKCAYCDFNSAPAPDGNCITRYVNAVIAHMERYRVGAKQYEPDTVFIGGGTPTSIPMEELVRLIKAVKRNFRLTKNVEFSMEANPATVTGEGLARLRRMGVNRLSFGLQSAHENELKVLSRLHSRQDFVRSYKMAREAGFDNINIDLMFGIPYQTIDSLMHTLHFVTRLNPDHISLYDLKIEPGTKFYRDYDQIKPFLPEEDTEADMYLSAIEFLRNRGYYQYEISNFARPGRMCMHNLKYWNCEEYLGFGVSAHSYFNGNRFAFTPDREKYCRAMEVPGSPIKLTVENEAVEERERLGEYIMLRFRLTEGLDTREFIRRFGTSFEALYGHKLNRFIKGGYMTCQGGRYALTPQGMFVSNYILSEILEFEDFGKYMFS